MPLASREKMILEIAILNVIAELELEFETAFRKASSIIASMNGYVSHQLQRCIEHSNHVMAGEPLTEIAYAIGETVINFDLAQTVGCLRTFLR